MGYCAFEPDNLVANAPVPSLITPTDGNILCQPFAGVTTDLTGNHTFPAGIFANAGYNGGTILDVENGGSLTSSGGIVHRIATASPVSFGGMFRFVEPPQAASPYLICSAQIGGTGNHNYSMVFVAGALNLQSGGGSVRNFGWRPQSDVSVSTPLSTGWVHVIMEVEAGRTTGRLYLNGKQFGPDQTGLTVGAPGGSDALFVGGIGGVAAGELGAFLKNVFIRDSIVGASTARRLAEESFGHVLPL